MGIVAEPLLTVQEFGYTPYAVVLAREVLTPDDDTFTFQVAFAIVAPSFVPMAELAVSQISLAVAWCRLFTTELTEVTTRRRS
jgi:hypothetical protein